jgi:hypothetical protein
MKKPTNINVNKNYSNAIINYALDTYLALKAANAVPKPGIIRLKIRANIATHLGTKGTLTNILQIYESLSSTAIIPS